MTSDINSLNHYFEQLNKPDVFPLSKNVLAIQPGTPFKHILKHIRRSSGICFTESFSFAMAFYTWLKKYNAEKYPIKDYASYRLQREKLREVCANVFIKVAQHKLSIAKSPEIPWIKQFYPDTPDFYMRFTDILGMNGAYQWYLRGIKLPVLKDLVNPFYGAYFPTRHDHLILFDQWLSNQKTFKRGLDIGCGSGVLSLMMHKHKIPFIHATDTNINAIYSTKQEFLKRQMQNNTLVEHAAFTGSFVPGEADLMVFNPPWIPLNVKSDLDTATYYGDTFFNDFFSDVIRKMNKDTTLLIIFSDFAEVVGLCLENPIEKEIKSNEGFELQGKFEASLSQKPSKGKDWLSTIRQEEKVSLYVIKKVM